MHLAIESWQWESAGRLLLSLVVAGVIGLEREFHGRAAGLRTHTLVCMSCCLVMLVSTDFVRIYSDLTDHSVVRLDPARVAYGVMTGVGFLGAGVIMKTGVSVHGLTTAASLWCVAALGLAIGVGMYFLSVCTAVLVLFALSLMRQMGNWIPGHIYHFVRLTLADTQDLGSLRNRLGELGATVLSLNIDHHRRTGKIIASFRLRFTGQKNAIKLHQMLLEQSDFEQSEVR